jgi:hypothetical protein
MRVWRFTFHDDDSGSGVCIEWSTSKRAALRRMREVDEQYKDTQCGYSRDDTPELVTIPTTREALVAWLNRHACVG